MQSQTHRCSAVLLSQNSQTWLIPHKSRSPQPVNINKKGHFTYYLWQLKTPFIKQAEPQPPSLGILQGGGVLCNFPESVDLCFLWFRPSISTLSTGHLGQLPVAIYSFRILLTHFRQMLLFPFCSWLERKGGEKGTLPLGPQEMLPYTVQLRLLPLTSLETKERSCNFAILNGFCPSASPGAWQ